MAKTTKQTSRLAGEAGAEPVSKKTASRKIAARKTSSKSPATKKTVSTGKAAVKKAAPVKTPAKKPAPHKKAASATVVHRQISSAERHGMIAEAAYLRGEAHGFLSDAQEDWLLAEAEVDSLLSRECVTVSE